MFHSEKLNGLRRRCARVFLPLAILVAVAILPNSVRADTITLTGGQVIVDRLEGFISVQLVGGGLSINSRVDLPAPIPPGFDYVSSTFGCGCDGFGLVMFNGVTNSAFSGGGSFTESTITGSLTIHGNFDNSLDQPPFPFTLNYVGTGVLEITPNHRTTFTVNSPVPEPASVLLLMTGVAGAAAALRRRRARDR